jgi:hypothetical protein
LRDDLDGCPRFALEGFEEARGIAAGKAQLLNFFVVIVRRQSFWDRRWLKIRESLAPLVCNIMRLADGAASGDWRWSVV